MVRANTADLGQKAAAIARAGFASLIVSFTGITAAQAFQISPISQEFSPSGRNATQLFQIVNDRDVQVTVIVSAATREVDADGNERQRPTGDFTLFPTEVVLPPMGT